MNADRQAMVELAVKRFAECGREGLRPVDLARRLGLPARVVFRQFKNRDQVLLAVLVRVQEELFAHIEVFCPVVPGETGLSMVLRLAEAYCRFLEERPGPYLDLLRAEAEAQAGTGPESRQELRRIQARIVKQFEVLLLLGHLDGSVRDGAAEEAARRIVNVVVGVVRLGLTRPTARARNLRLMLTSLTANRRLPARAA